MENCQNLLPRLKWTSSDSSLPEDLHHPKVRLISVTKSFDTRSNHGSGSEDGSQSGKTSKNKSKKCIKQNSIEYNGQFELNQLAERLRYIEQKLLENERNTEQKFRQIYTNGSTSRSQTAISYSPLFSKSRRNPIKSQTVNDFGKPCICPSASADDCSKLGKLGKLGSNGDSGQLAKCKAKGKRIFSATAKTAIQNSRSIPSLHVASQLESQNYKDLLEKHPLIVQETYIAARSYPNTTNFRSSTGIGREIASTGSIVTTTTAPSSSTGSGRGWRAPFNMIGNLVDERILKGRWNSSKSIRSSSSSGSIRSNSVCSALSATIPTSTGGATIVALRNATDASRRENNSSPNSGKSPRQNLQKVYQTSANRSNTSLNRNSIGSTACSTPAHNATSQGWLHWPIQDEQTMFELERKSRLPAHVTLLNGSAGAAASGTNGQRSSSTSSEIPSSPHRMTTGQPPVDALAEIEAFERLLSKKFALKSFDQLYRK